MCGSTATEAVLVCTRPCVSVTGTRCTRCTPDSNRSAAYALSATSASTLSPFAGASKDAAASRSPPLSCLEHESISKRQPRRLACSSYIFNRSAANSAASSPPAPARTSRTAPVASSASSRGSNNKAKRSSISRTSRSTSSRSAEAIALSSSSSSLFRCRSTEVSDSISSRRQRRRSQAATTRSTRESSLFIDAIWRWGGGGSATSDWSRSSLRRTVASRRAASAGVMMDARSWVPGEDASAERRRGKSVGATRATGVRERGVASNDDRKKPETPRRA
mmetsp:Transcript_956/g.4056  ORF Transcript_956/g.4056 Transcript_956/m.4056 type:complete len:278 (+) Transcript_956:527-1360(+)